MRPAICLTQSFLLGLWAAGSAEAAVIQGLVLDASTREGIGRVAIRGCSPSESVTYRNGRFRLEVSVTECIIQIAAVGYRPVSVKLTDLIENATTKIDVAMHPDTLRRSDSVDVAAPPFAGEEGTAVALAGNELRNLGSVLADDPLRAVQHCRE